MFEYIVTSQQICWDISSLHFECPEQHSIQNSFSTFRMIWNKQIFRKRNELIYAPIEGVGVWCCLWTITRTCNRPITYFPLTAQCTAHNLKIKCHINDSECRQMSLSKQEKNRVIVLFSGNRIETLYSLLGRRFLMFPSRLWGKRLAYLQCEQMLLGTPLLHMYMYSNQQI